jgi:AmmeMemoRadiSam system protein B
MTTRRAAVEGRFYPSGRSRIFDQIREIEKAQRYIETDLVAHRIFGAVLPHAGHIYSGYQTIPFFNLLNRMGLTPDTFVIVHPNHAGYGTSPAVDEADTWQNSIGDVHIDEAFAHAMELPFDRTAHAHEHSAEVIIPFLQYYFPDHPFKIVPVSMREQDHASASRVAESLLNACRTTGRNMMILSSCDFSHFLTPDEGRNRDQKVIDEILLRNAQGVEKAVRRHRASVCGYGPIMVLMEFAAAYDTEYRVEILARGHSGEVFSSPEVVDYISMVFFQ